MRLGEWLSRQRTIGMMRETLAVLVAKQAEPLADGEAREGGALAHGTPGTQFDPEERTGFWLDPESREWTVWAWWGPADHPQRLVVRASDLRRNEKLEALHRVGLRSHDEALEALRNAGPPLPRQDGR